jgi:RNA polymerase-interacting CarD/CdnL/TRCF family regulator
MASYTINQSVYIPGHGISTLKEIKEISVAGTTQTMLAFEVTASGARIMVPEGKVVANCRTPAAVGTAQAALELLKATPQRVENKPNYKKWNRMILETIQAGDTIEIAALVSKLDGQRNEHPLAVNEMRLLITAKQILKSELDFALGQEVVEQHTQLLAA